ncbi:DNA repair protein RecN [Demequina zhanjiangensis]|uniref:DNA repair protein RecN n=1 Tax=Demequina zhanjiangensis TaxID=3051659 RepID=A0ABT8G1Q0_9MICO|nr:DNA repair protein RecN [Demequina sp. SYSU T00b26]MDN4473070.1 DNA repair protein RecN [Demequina sp. SYSU T00b26]
MLHELSIENLGVIDSARLELGPGLTVVSGETGAGKTMVLTGLGLILGSKAVPATVRVGADSALAEAIVDVEPGSSQADRLEDAGAVLDEDGTVVVSRSVGATTRSRTVIGGRTVPQALLAELAAEWVTVHGQADQQRLRSAARQRSLLDEYAGADHASLLTEFAEAWAAWREAREELERMESGADRARMEAARMRDDLAAIDEVDPQPGEDEALAAEAELLQNSEAVRSGVAGAHEAIDGESETTLVVAVEAARRALGEAAQHDPVLAELEQRLAEVSYTASDVAMELSSYLDRMDADPARLDAVLSRRSALAGLMRRVGTDMEGLLAYRLRAAETVAEDDEWDERLEIRREAAARAETLVRDVAARVTEGRVAASERLAVAVNAELAGLAMPDAQFAVTVEPDELRHSGADAVTMTLAAHPGAPSRPVADAASGGELSRVMLAIEVSLARGAHRPGHTFVFDEVDAGVGGKAAQAVGRRLAELAQTHQVLVVTHLAQVAAFADTHVVVAKATDGAITRSQVGPVDGDARIQEVARLLSGHEDSDTARAHALELLEASRVAP